MLDRSAWHELKLTIDGADLKTWLDGEIALEYTLGSTPGPRPQQRAAEPGPDSGEQPGPASTGGRQDRPLGENRHDQLFQRLRGEPQMSW
jgi:hypothetical protein